LNLGSDDDALRSTAYDLVCVVATSLNYDDPQIVPVNGKSFLVLHRFSR
jgi:hypothetical protein